MLSRYKTLFALICVILACMHLVLNVEVMFTASLGGATRNVDKAAMKIPSQGVETFTWNATSLLHSCEFIHDTTMYRPVILIAMGRSGSSVTWDTLSRMTGTPTEAEEFTGSKHESSNDFFENHIPSHVGSQWALRRLCELQHKHTVDAVGAGIVGFQWKPFANTWTHPYATGALDELMRYNQQQQTTNSNNKIRILHLIRNPMDKLISNLRHQKSNNQLGPHCSVGDDECLKQFDKIGKVELPTGPELIKGLRQSNNQGNRIHGQLQRLFSNTTSYHFVSYESLYEEPNTTTCLNTWKGVVEFLGFDTVANSLTTLEDVTRHFSMAKTSSGSEENSRKRVISNYDTVVESLKGTDFEHLV